ncbi:MAG: chromosomal replication initiator protein DnaA [Planctomycetaceae bacterium]|nr:chromosomal replication initiator protein DnaA [Planctomycetaceae bacterium]
MAKDDKEIVAAVLLALADSVGAERYETWFGAHTRLNLSGDVLLVSVPSAFYQDWLRRNFRTQIESACQTVLGKPVAVTFQVDSTLANTTGESGPNNEPPQTDDSSVVASPAAASDAPAVGSPGIFARRRFSSFDTFVLGKSNRLAHTAARRLLEQPGYNSPLVIHGSTGVGKTHLLEAIWVAARRMTKCDVVYLTGEQFATQFIDALNGRGLPSFRRKYRSVDLLLIDDLQFFAGKRATQTELLHTVDVLQSAGKQIVFAADRSPALIDDLQPELVARLSGGLSCHVELPDYETRLGIVRRVGATLGVLAAEDVWAWIAEHIASHARALIGAVKRLQLAALASGRSISLSLAQESLAEMRESAARCIRLADVEQAVCRSFGLEPASLQEPASTKRIQAARMLAMWLARKHTRNALSEIGRYFGLRSHSTVVSAQKRVEQWVAERAEVDLGTHLCAMDEAVRRVERTLLAS